jgi:hypothetical protein
MIGTAARARLSQHCNAAGNPDVSPRMAVVDRALMDESAVGGSRDVSSARPGQALQTDLRSGILDACRHHLRGGRTEASWELSWFAIGVGLLALLANAWRSAPFCWAIFTADADVGRTHAHELLR